MNVDQLSRCYAGLSTDGPLQFTHTVRPRRANRKRRAMVKEQSRQGHHQMNLRQTTDLDFDGNTGMSHLAISLDSLHMGYSESVPRNAESVPVKISSLKVDRSAETQEQLALGMLLESVTAKQTEQRLLDGLNEILPDEVEIQKEEVCWNWRRRKKLDLTREEKEEAEAKARMEEEQQLLLKLSELEEREQSLRAQRLQLDTEDEERKQALLKALAERRRLEEQRDSPSDRDTDTHKSPEEMAQIRAAKAATLPVAVVPVVRLEDQQAEEEEVERARKEEEEDVDVEEVEWMRRIWTRPKKLRSSEF
ncbi:MAG: hypothetical protein GY820_09935 [Gammaproteobacteria bacterium]|nr:hypothetical protein [Gammaproteobacteria bacterium]